MYDERIEHKKCNIVSELIVRSSNIVDGCGVSMATALLARCYESMNEIGHNKRATTIKNNIIILPNQGMQLAT